MPCKDPERRRQQVNAANRRWRERHPQRVRELGKNNDHKRRYGITIVERDELLGQQGGRCAACFAPEPGAVRGWHTDHDHNNGKLRGILCQRCNLALGHSKEDPNVLRLLAEYIEKHST